MHWNRMVAVAGLLLIATESIGADELPAGAIRVRGEVVDAETGEQLKKFRLIVGSPFNDIHTTWQGHLVSQHTGGQYTWRNDRPWRKTRLRIEAEGYRPATSPTLERGAGELSINFKLKPDAGLSGEVQDADGKPVPDAEIAMTTQTFETSVDEGKLRYANGTRLGAQIVTTDAEGKFQLPAEGDPFLIVAAHTDHGFAVFEKSDLAQRADAGQPIVIKLEPWCRVEGQCVDADGKPDANADYALSVGWQPKQEWPVLHHHSSAKTDEQGRFICEYVAGGSHFLQQWGKPDANGTRSAGTTYRLEAVAGKTMRLNVGSQLRPIKGRLSVAAGLLPDEFDFRDLTLNFTPKARPVGFGNRVFFGDGGKRVKLNVPVNEKGEFEVAQLVPGNYSASVQRKPGTEAAKWNLRVNYTLTVPLVDQAEEDTPHDLGDLTMFARLLPDL